MINGILQSWVIISILVVFLMGATSYGKKLLFLGSSPRATVYAGYSPKAIILGVFILAAVFSTITGATSG